MTRKYSLVIDGDSTGYSAYVPELPTILVTGKSIDELTARAGEAIRIYWESAAIERSPTSMLREIDVELPD
jgi:predicted RNase H-like HicB family nuclease